MGLNLFDQYSNVLQVSVQVRKKKRRRRGLCFFRASHPSSPTLSPHHHSSHQVGLNLRDFEVVSVRVFDYYFSGNNWGK